MDRQILFAWLSGRSIARGLPAPIADRGGYRVDTNNDVEIARWVFPRMGAGLVELARSIEGPRRFLKLCAPREELLTALSDRWQVHAPSYVMQAGETPVERPIPEGYRIEIDRRGEVIEARATLAGGGLAASGYAAETADAFIYDRIVTAPQHRRRGLGQAIMSALRRSKHVGDKPELLVATEDGLALYAALGWRVISPYSSASIPDGEGPSR